MGGSLTLSRAIDLALGHNPGLRADCLKVQSLDSRSRQEGLWPNPALGVEIEEFAGTGEFEDGRSRASTVSVSQEFDLAGKWKLRKKAADRETDLARRELELSRRSLTASVKKSFYAVLAAQERTVLADEMARTAEEVHQTVAEQVQAGKVAALELDRSEIVLAQARLEQSTARRGLAGARAELSAFWGSAEASFTEARGDLSVMEPLPDYEQLVERVGRSPELLWWDAELARREAELDLARLAAAPNLTLGVGVRSFQASDDTAYVAEASIPAPLFDRNQGGVGAARYSVEEGKERRRSLDAQARASLFQAYQSLCSAHEIATVMERETAPQSERIYEAMVLGYRAGKFGYLALLDAQERLARVKGEHLEARLEYHRAEADLELIIGDDFGIRNENPIQPPGDGK